MNLLPFIWAAGILLSLIVLSGFFTPGLLKYAESMKGAEPTVREIFYIHNTYVTLFVACFAVLCFAFGREMAGGSAMGRFLSGFLGAIWLLRLGIQVFYHNAEIKRAYPVMNVVFSATFLYLGVVFSLAAIGLGRD